ncbi:hypothetical protein [Cryptosporangium sp. NPDC051539]|uniref:hypothetical protein n=1 Tax=Cryptosporangium sp. NPDC051539 TaxID=3363962 RepID=UPI0037B9BE90
MNPDCHENGEHRSGGASLPTDYTSFLVLYEKHHASEKWVRESELSDLKANLLDAARQLGRIRQDSGQHRVAEHWYEVAVQLGDIQCYSRLQRMWEDASLTAESPNDRAAAERSAARWRYYGVLARQRSLHVADAGNASDKALDAVCRDESHRTGSRLDSAEVERIASTYLSSAGGSVRKSHNDIARPRVVPPGIDPARQSSSRVLSSVVALVALVTMALTGYNIVAAGSFDLPVWTFVGGGSLMLLAWSAGRSARRHADDQALAAEHSPAIW